MGLITCTYCTGIFMCAGLLLQDDEGSPVQHAKGAPSLLFSLFFFFSLWKRKAQYFTSIPEYLSMAEQSKN